ncbi:carbamoyltransferase HypF [Actinomadura viridis]|uniref:Carbamoyltransferase n=1 Tax=Actinomadura viridis TaxID=58110 RepID=A0A931DL03_9ACTN|nr:carbamoyltransferase HypF [Actinomadura viridis]MBG6089486.1 hydrogenase maturation protein HypF [Actinomadura viridis]
MIDPGVELPARTRIRIRVEGTVQGVGFRPFVYALAAEHGVAGFVGNDCGGVFAEVEGDPPALAAFVGALERRAPPLAVVERVTTEPIPAVGERGFRIAPSEDAEARRALVPPDLATCEDCLAEVFAPSGRRRHYAFTNCTGCGPRFTIVTGVPYDRAATTMAGFALCDDCAGEYKDPEDRRFHAQPVCCPACGPALRFHGPNGRPVRGEPVEVAARWLRQGRIVAVKGLGGYHLAVLADHEAAVTALRDRKHREAKPFAVMVPDLDAARTLVGLEEAAERLLSGTRRPIVLLPRRLDARVAQAVAPGARHLGIMLPYTPLHHLLARRVARPIVLTSGNVSDEPIAHRDEDAVTRLSGIADGFLLHDRPIHVRADDSVVRLFRGRELPLRRSRGYVPSPLTVRTRFARPLLACGAELKNTFCVASGDRVFLSPHIGDLENYETLRSFTEGIEHFCRLFGVRPQIIAHDLHPDYLSTKYALERGDAETAAVQHHHAHIASCLADNGHDGPVIGIALDGLGYGDDGTLWGGELLVADLAGYERAGHLETVPMPGGAAAVREPWRMAAAHLDALYGDDVPDLAVVRRHPDQWASVTTLARTRTNAPSTSSAGRLFDAVSAIVCGRDTAAYEGQAAIELEQRADTGERGGYAMTVTDGAPLLLRGTDLVRGAVDDLASGVGPGRIAARFHNGLAFALVRAACALRDRTGLRVAALSGGVFQNMILLERVVTGLERENFTVLVHSRVPPNDGGICLGQAVVAATRLATP